MGPSMVNVVSLDRRRLSPVVAVDDIWVDNVRVREKFLVYG